MPIPQARARCQRCVLPESNLDIQLDESGICNLCRAHEQARRSAPGQADFLESDLLKILKIGRKKKKGKYDCLVMCSGGKDSTSSLYHIVNRYKLNPLAFTFDHDFETNGALENVRRAVKILGVDWHYFRSDFMKEIFTTLVKERSPAVLCHLCSMWYMALTYETAANYGIPLIIAGWTKGQASVQPVLSKCACDVETAEYRKMGQATQQFLDRHLPSMPRYKGFPTSMASVAARAAKKYKIRVISPHWFLGQSVEEYVAMIQQELGWRYPRLSYPAKSTNCELNFLSVELSMQNYGYTHYHVEMSKMIRMGLTTRAESLELLERNYSDEDLAGVLSKLGLGLEDIR